MKRSVPLSALRDTPVSARARIALLTKVIAERDEQIRWDGLNLVHRPDLSRCVWPHCLDPKSKRYGVHLCTSHAQMIAGRIRNMDAVHMQPNSLEVDLELIALRRDVALRDAVIAHLHEEAKPSKRAMPTVGTVYFLQIGGHIKIGWTSDLTKRMRQYPPNTVLLAAHPGERKDELRLHKMFKVHCSHGNEWYPLAPVILAHIARVVAEHGAPAEVRFGAKPTTVPQPRQRQYVGGDRIGSGSTPRTVRG